MGRSLAIAAFAALALGLAGRAGNGSAEGNGLSSVQAVRPGLGVAAHRIADLTGDGRDELLLVGEGGEVRVWRRGSSGQRLLEPVGGEPVAIADPAHTLLAVAPLGAAVHLGDGQVLSLLSLSPAGLALHAFDAEGRVGPSQRLARRARFGLRVGRPTFAEVLQDVNRDGRPDLVVPTGETCELWLNAGPDGDPPRPVFTREAVISVDMERWGGTGAEDLFDVLESSFAIPGLQTRDVNGDGRPDLLVVEGRRRSFHLQAADGSFPGEPDVTVDLGIFKDTESSSGVAPGQSLSFERGATFEMRDLDGDGIPDYVLAHRRKVWVFLASGAGPQFTRPASILRSAEDVTTLTVLDLDDDELPDLLLVKVQVPTVATLIRGLIGEWDVKIISAGYRNTGRGNFETKADWRSEIVIRLPSIIRILKDPGSILERFEDAESRFRISLWAQLDADGSEDLVLISEDRTRIEVWRGRGGGRARLDAEQILRQLLFEEEDNVYDLDRAMMWLGGLADRQVALQTEGREPDASRALRSANAAVLASLRTADFDGDGRQEIVVGYLEYETGELVLDVLRLE